MSRAAIVTGASAGIGLAVTAELCRRGYAVTMAARKHERLEVAAEQLRDAGHDVTPVALDVTAAGAAAQLVGEHIDRRRRLDVVVANAGWGTAGPVAATRPADLDRMLQVNVGATFALAAAAVPHLRRTDVSAGAAWFVITASIAGVWPTTGFAGYSATKAAALSIARSLAAEESDNGLRACAICPAYVETDMTRWLGDQLATTEMLMADDVAAAVGFLLNLSPNASITELVLRRAGAPSPDAP